MQPNLLDITLYAILQILEIFFFLSAPTTVKSASGLKPQSGSAYVPQENSNMAT